MWIKLKAKLSRISIAGVLLILIAIPLTYFLTLTIMRMTVRSMEPIPFERPAPIVQGENIPINSGVVPVAEAGDFSMTVDTRNLNLAITHAPTGRVFQSLVTSPLMPVVSRSPIVIRFLGEDSMLYEWNAYDYVISNDQFRIYQIENGVQFVLDFFETESTRLLEYIPSRISIERYHARFIEPLAALEAAGEITSERADQYRRALNLVYQRDDNEGVYFYMLGGLPPSGLVTLLISMTRAVGYTREYLIDDLDDLGLFIYFVEPAAFTITMNHTLTSDGEFIVDIPVDEHINNNEFFTLQNILIYPAFDATFAENNEGFIFVPCGAGMLMRLDSFDIRRSNFSRPVFNHMFFDQDNHYFRPGHEEDIHMPVFGMWNTQNGVDSGFFTIIEYGAQTANIGATLRASGGGAGPMYNAVFGSVDTKQFSRVRIFGPFSAEQARFLASTGDLSPHIRFRYVLFPENAGYFEFSQVYRQHLIDTQAFEVRFQDEPQIFVELIGAVTVLRNFAGIPFYSNIPMTSYTQAAYIINDLRSLNINVVANLKYGINGGRSSIVGNQVQRVRQMGSNAEFDDLLALSRPGQEVFVEANLIRMYRPSRRFNTRRFMLSDFGTAEGVWLSDQWSPAGFMFFDWTYNIYHFIHPRYLPFVVDGFISDAAGRIDNVTLPDFGTIPFANYDPRDIVSPYDAQFGILHPMLERLRGEFNLALDNPNMDRLHFASYALNISRESSQSGVFYASVPFRQLVMNGLVSYTTLNVNGAMPSLEYFLLQSVELGSIPKFTVFYEPTSLLLNEGISRYFSHEYRRLREDILWLANAQKEAFAQIGTTEIVHHEMLLSGVFVTTYATGARVYVNYNLFPVSGEDFALDALSFKIVGGIS